MSSPIAVEVVLSERGREQRELCAASQERSGLGGRSRIVLAAAKGLKNAEISWRLFVDQTTVRKWRSRFAKDRLDGLLLGEPRPGRPRTISDARVEEIVAGSCHLVRHASRSAADSDDTGVLSLLGDAEGTTTQKPRS